MKAVKGLRIVLLIAIIILLSVISFGGIYYQDKGNMKNRLPSYILGANLEGYRHVTLVTTEDANSTNEVSSENATNEVNTSSENTSSNEENELNENSLEDLNLTNETNTTSENTSNNAGKYKDSAKIFKNRLKSLNIDNYNVSCDLNTGRIVIDLPENDRTDTILSDLVEVGKFSIIDSKTKEELLNNGDVKSVKFGSQTSGTSTSLVMAIEFNTKGAKKFAKVTKEYQNNVDENATNTSNETDSNLVGSNEENSTENTSEENSTNTTSDSSTEKKSKKVTLKIDDSELLTTDFSEIIDNGVLTLTVGSGSDSEQDYAAMNLGAIIENDPLPIEYKIDGNTYVESSIENNALKIIIYAEIIIALIVSLILIAKYRMTGIWQVILSIGYVAILLITIRLANVVISLDGIFTILICYLLNSSFAFLISKVLSNKDLSKKEKTKSINNAIKKYCLIVIPELIVSIICLFTSWSAIFSLGMILFWGVAISLIYNIIITKWIN